MVAVVNWPTVVGIMLIIFMASLSWWRCKKRQMIDSGLKVKLAGVECPIGAPYQDQQYQVAIGPVADMEEQSPVAGRDLEPDKGLRRPVVKTQPSRKTRV